MQDSEGYTPLMNACQEGDLAMVTLLLEYNADTQMKDEKGSSTIYRFLPRSSISVFIRIATIIDVGNVFIVSFNETLQCLAMIYVYQFIIIMISIITFVVLKQGKY